MCWMFASAVIVTEDYVGFCLVVTRALYGQIHCSTHTFCGTNMRLKTPSKASNAGQGGSRLDAPLPNVYQPPIGSAIESL